MFSAASVCQFVRLFVNTVTFERLNIGWWNLAISCTVQKFARVRMSRSKVKGQGHRAKNEKVRRFVCESSSGRGPPPVLRRWEDQRMPSNLYLIFNWSEIISTCHWFCACVWYHGISWLWSWRITTLCLVVFTKRCSIKQSVVDEVAFLRYRKPVEHLSHNTEERL